MFDKEDFCGINVARLSRKSVRQSSIFIVSRDFELSRVLVVRSSEKREKVKIMKTVDWKQNDLQFGYSRTMKPAKCNYQDNLQSDNVQAIKVLKSG